MSDDLQSKKAAVRRIFERFNESQDKYKLLFVNGSMTMLKSDDLDMLLLIPEHMLLEPKVFEQVHSFVINKLNSTPI